MSCWVLLCSVCRSGHCWWKIFRWIAQGHLINNWQNWGPWSFGCVSFVFFHSTTAAKKQILWPEWTSVGSIRDRSLLPWIGYLNWWNKWQWVINEGIIQLKKSSVCKQVLHKSWKMRLRKTREEKKETKIFSLSSLQGKHSFLKHPMWHFSLKKKKNC